MKNATQSGKSVFFFPFFCIERNKNTYLRTTKLVSFTKSACRILGYIFMRCIIDLLTFNLPPKTYLFDKFVRSEIFELSITTALGFKTANILIVLRRNRFLFFDLIKNTRKQGASEGAYRTGMAE